MFVDYTNPVYRMETRRQISSKRLMTLQRGCLPVLTIVVTISLTLVTIPLMLSRPFSFEAYINQLLSATFAILAVIQLLAGIGIAILTIGQSSPAISGELEVKSWDLLRTTTLSLREVIFGKFAAVMARLRTPLAAVLLLRLLSTITALLLFTWLLLRSSLFRMSPGELNEFVASWLWLPGAAVTVLVILFYLTQPLVQFSINASMGLFFSALTRSQGRALAGGLAGRLVLWVVMAGVYFAAFRLIIFASDNLYGSGVAPYLVGLSLEREILLVMGVIAAVLLLILMWQVGLMLFLLGWVHRRASRLGALT